MPVRSAACAKRMGLRRSASAAHVARTDLVIRRIFGCRTLSQGVRYADELRMNTRSYFRAGMVIAALLAFVVLPSFVDFSMDWMWFGAVGYRDVFLRGLKARASLGAFVLGLGFFILYGNLWFAVSSIASPYIVLGTGRGGTVQPAMVRREQLRKLTGIG